MNKLMSRTLLAIGGVAIACLLLARAHLFGTGSPVRSPPVPAISLQEAVKLGDDYIRKQFPDFGDLYCGQAYYNSNPGNPVPPTLWILTYYLPLNPYIRQPGLPSPDDGSCLVYVHPDKSLTHVAPPHRNLSPVPP